MSPVKIVYSKHMLILTCLYPELENDRRTVEPSFIFNIKFKFVLLNPFKKIVDSKHLIFGLLRVTISFLLGFSIIVCFFLFIL